MPHENTLLVEGINDLHAVRNLLYQHGVLVYYEHDNESPDPKSCMFEIKTVGEDQESGGESKFSRAIKAHLKEEDPEDIRTLGVVADADDDRSASWEARMNELFSFEEGRVFTSLDDYNIQEGWTGETQHYVGDPVDVGAWVMPDNESRGALEDFAATLIPANEEDQYLWSYAVEVVDGLKVQRFRDADKGKANMHTWLAWQDPPRELIGRSINRETGGLDSHSNLAQRFVQWIRRLFPAQGEAVQQ